LPGVKPETVQLCAPAGGVVVLATKQVPVLGVPDATVTLY
jgi:hypothetical protein